MITRITFLVVLIVSSLNWCAAQTILIKGKVVDAVSFKPLEFATVSILQKDSSIAKTTATDKEGIFSIKTSLSKSIIRVQFVGYSSFDSTVIKPDGQREITLQDIFLSPVSKALSEVTVSGRKAVNSVQLEKQVISVSQFQNTANGTGLDIVQRLPSVTVNTEGLVALRGSTNFTILINGKFSNRSPSDVLAQIPANAIESIEVITSPSAKYDAEGKAGIINIVTKKNVLLGWNISSNAMFAGIDPLRFGGDVTVNYNAQKWSAFVAADYRRYNINGYRVGEVRTIFNDTLTFQPSDGIRPLKDLQYGIRAGINYSPNTNNTLNAGFYYGYKQTDRTANLYYDEYIKTTPPHDLYSQSGFVPQRRFYNQNLFIRTGKFFTFNSDYTHQFKNKSKIILTGIFEHSVLGGPLRNQDNDLQTGALLLKEKSDETSPLNAWRLQADYQLPLNKNQKIEIGYQWRFVHHKGDFTFERLDIPSGTWTKDPEFNDALDLKQTIHAAYIQYNRQIKKFSFNAGLRAEYMNRRLTHTLGLEPFSISQTNLFPSIQGLWSLKNRQKIRIGYSKRIDRPTTKAMSPFKNHRHSEAIELGDPELLPELTDVAEISYNNNFKKASFNITVYVNFVKDKIFRVNEIYSRITLLRTFTNAGRSKSYGTELSVETKPLKWLRFYTSGNFYRFNVKGNIKGEEVNQSSFNYNLNGNITVDIGKKIKFQWDANYLSRTVTSQGEEGELFLSNAGLRYNISNKITSGLLLQNIFNSNHQIIATRSRTFDVFTNYIKYDRILQFNFSYRFNDNGKKGKTLKTEYGEKDF